MPYFVQTKPEVAAYIDAVEGLSPAGRDALVDGYVEELGQDADKFLALDPLGPESLHFRYDTLQPDSGTLFVFDFVVDGTQVEVGVVTVVFLSHTTHRAGDPD